MERPGEPTAPSEPALGPRASAAALPPEVLRRARQRLGMTALLCMVSFAVSFPVMNWVGIVSEGDLRLGNKFAFGSIAFSFVVFLYARFTDRAPNSIVTIGLVYEVFLGLGIALSELFASYEPFGTVRGISWLCLWIAMYPLILPSTPIRTFLAAVATATTGPFALLLGILFGDLPVPDFPTFLFLYLPNYFAAALATVASATLFRLHADANRAHELGSYKLVELLGRGGMGEVWRATHRMLARPAAIKLIRADSLFGRDGAKVRSVLRRFKREAETTARLTSPHTVQLFDFGTTHDGTLYYVMELLDGIDLETLVLREGPQLPARTVHLLRQVCQSLAEAHDTGLVHRDVKPANIYVCKLGTGYDHAKVLDFGLVAVQEGLDEAETRVTADGHVTGTPAYMAPEMVRGESDPDERVDVYAIGCTAYYMLTGELVFTADNPLAMVFSHVERDPVSPSKRSGRDLPKDLERLVMDCLSKDPDDRPRDARDVADRLAECQVTAWTQEDARERWQAFEARASGPDSADAFADTSEMDLRVYSRFGG